MYASKPEDKGVLVANMYDGTITLNDGLSVDLLNLSVDVKNKLQVLLGAHLEGCKIILKS